MKTNPVKQKLRDGQPSFGTWLSLGNLLASRVLARSGFDWLTIDMEHQAIDWREAASLVGAIADAGCVPLIRVPEGNYFLIKRALDAGAWGIVVPMVNTVEEAQTAIAAAKYPPEGIRSSGGGMHALNFDTTTREYHKRANDEILVVLQTESPQGVENAEAIYALPGVDAIFVGPTDLRANMRTADGGEASDEQFEAMLARVVEAGRKTGTPTGMHTMNAEAAQSRVAQGMRFMAVSMDQKMMAERALEILEVISPESVNRNVTQY